MKRALITILATLLLTAVLAPTEALGAFNGSVSVDSIEVTAGSAFALPVRLSGSDLAFSGMRIPLRFDPSLVDLDSVSFVGSIKPSNFTVFSDMNNISGTVDIIYLADTLYPVPTLGTAAGIIATIYGHAPQSATGQKAVFDSVNVLTALGSGVFLWDRPEVTDDGGAGSNPIQNFSAGAIMIGTSTGIDDKGDQVLPARFDLAQNYPNPFNPTTTIQFSIPKAGHVKLQVFNILGQTVRTLLDADMVAGEHQIQFDANGLPSGIYFYRLSHPAGTSTRKMALIK